MERQEAAVQRRNDAGTGASTDTTLTQPCSLGVRALLAPLQLALDCLTDELRSLVRPRDGVDPIQRIFCQPDQRRSHLHRRSAHENNPHKSDIAY